AVFTFSMHCRDNFPVRKQSSDLDIGLPSGTGDRDYLDILSAQLPDLLANLRPDLVFYNAGVDPHHADVLGKLALTDRDAMVITACARRNLPVACVVGGGYDRNSVLLAQRHALLYRAADHTFRSMIGLASAVSAVSH
nr:histone deacetylase [Alphaproteobacteria bacterium]